MGATQTDTKAVNLVTGTRGTAHVTSANARQLNAGIFGRGKYVLHGCEATHPSNNTITIGAGDIMIGGAHISIDSPVNLSISAGSQGVNRVDTIVAQYVKNQNGTESANLMVFTGDAGSTDAVGFADTSPLDGYSTSYFALYKVEVSGISVGNPVALFNENAVPTLEEIGSKLQSGTVGQIVQALSSGASAADGSWRDMSGTMGLSIDVPSGVWIVKGYIEVSVSSDAIIGLQVYNNTDSGSFGTDSSLINVNPDVQSVSVPITVVHFGQFAGTKNMCIRVKATSVNGGSVANTINSGYIRAMRIA